MPALDCSSCRAQLDLYALDALEPADKQPVESHMSLCAECRGELDRVLELVNGVAALGGDEDECDRRLARINARLREEIETARRRDRLARRTVIWARAAAIVAVGVVAALAIRPPRQEAPAGGERGWRYAGVGMYRGVDSAYPLVVGETVLALEDQHAGNRLLALDRNTGGLRWRTPFTVAGGGALSADGDQVFAWRVTDAAGAELVALCVDTGRVLWRCSAAEPGATPATPPLVAVRNGVCWAQGDAVTAVDGATGRLAWTRRPDIGGPLSVPASNSECVYVASNGGLCALHSQDGRLCWQTRYEPSARRLGATLLHYDGEKIVVAQRRLTGKGVLRSHDPASGQVRWERAADFPIHSFTLAGHVYVRSSGVCAFHGDTGRPLWSAPVDGCGPVALSRGRLFAVEGRHSESPLVLALDPETGERTWERALASSCSGLVVVGGTGYLSAHDGALYALAIGRSG